MRIRPQCWVWYGRRSILDIYPTSPSTSILGNWGPMPPSSLPPASLTPRSPVPTCPSPQAQGSFEISPSDTLWGSIGGVMQVCERHRRSTLYVYYLTWHSSISPRHTDENSWRWRMIDFLRPSPKGRLFSRDVGWWNLQCCHALPAWMSLGTSQNTEL